MYLGRVSDPEFPDLIGFIETPGSAKGVHVVNPYAYVTAGDELVILNFSDFLNP